jgi:hypothetical protein
MQHDAKTRAGKGGEKTEQPQRLVVYVVNPHTIIIFWWWSRQKPTKNPSNYCLAYLMMLLCWWCRAVLMFFFVLYDLVFFLAIKDDVDALVVLWLPRALFMPCNATACVEETFIFLCVLCFFLWKRTSAKTRAHRRNFDDSSCPFWCVKKCPFLGFFRAKRDGRFQIWMAQSHTCEFLKHEGRKNRKNLTRTRKTAHSIKSKAYLLSLSLVIYILRDSRTHTHTHREKEIYI